ncbi:MAG: hypothetical protein ACOX6D_02555 [Thermoguttaceae bacterium]|jgi:hypothetical protein
MAIRACFLIKDTASINKDGGSATREWDVYDDDLKCGGISIYQRGWMSGILPKKSGYYPDCADLRVKSIKTARARGKDSDVIFKGYRCYVWKVTVDYGPTEKEDPDLRDKTCKISGSGETVDLDGFVDWNGAWNTNSIGEWFAEPLPNKANVRVWTFQRTEYSNPEIAAYEYENAINSDPIWGFDPYTLLMKSVTSNRTLILEEGRFQWDVAYRVAYNPKTWLLQKANAGFYDADGNRLYNADGSPTETAQLLDAGGYKLESGAMPTMLSFQTYKAAVFGYLGLPSPIHDYLPVLTWDR